jgi:hypothetical protein
MEEYKDEDLKFDKIRYFEDYANDVQAMIIDFVHFAGAELVSNDIDLEVRTKKFQNLMNLPIYRGYLEEEYGKHYIDAYLYNGKIYNENDIINKIESEYEQVEFSIYTDSIEGYKLGIADLFYYKAGPDEKGKEYIEYYENKLEEPVEEEFSR